MRQPIVPSGMEPFYRDYHFAPAMRAGGLLFVSGQLGFRPDGRLAEGIAQQIDCAFGAIDHILGHAGQTMKSIVEIGSFHVGSLVTQMPSFINALQRLVGEPYPAWTAVEVAGLALPDALVEIRVIAVG